MLPLLSHHDSRELFASRLVCGEFATVYQKLMLNLQNSLFPCEGGIGDLWLLQFAQAQHRKALYRER